MLNTLYMIDIESILAKNKTLQQALVMLKEAVESPSMTDLMRDGAIQRFEYCFELAWKTVKIIIEYEDKEIGGSPRSILQKAIVIGILEDEEEWFRMLLERNNSVHTYREEIAKEIAGHLKVNYTIMKKLCDRIVARYKQHE